MSTAMEKTQQQSQMLTYRELFSTSESVQAQIVKAAGRLGYMLGKVPERAMLQGWVQNLEQYSPSQLQGAFERVETEVAAFPAVSHIVQILQRAEFDAQFAMILKGIRDHGYEWKDLAGWKERDKKEFHSPEALAHPDGFILTVGKIHPPVPAPVIPPRMVKALELFGQDGEFHTGLRRLYRDSPTFWDGDTVRNIGDHSKLASLIDKDLFACWLRS